MSWGGKVVGAGVGGLLGGPLGAAVGAGLGAVWDDLFDEDDAEHCITLDQLRFQPIVTTSGPGVQWVANFTSSMQIVEQCGLVVRFKRGDSYIRSANPLYGDEDGDLTGAGPVELGPTLIEGYGTASVPLSAFTQWPNAIDAEVWVVTASGSVLAHGSAEFDWPARLDFEDASLLSALVYCSVGLFCSNGALERSEVRTLRDFLAHEFELDSTGKEGLREIIKRARKAAMSPTQAAAAMRHHMSDELGDPLISMLYHMAEAAGPVSAGEQRWIASFSAALGISLPDHPAANRAHDLARYRDLLKVGPTASKAEIRRAFRREALDYHPDKAAALPSGFQEFANQRMRELNEARDALTAQAPS
jgi:DnaJ-domain-containing protein 1